MKSRNNGSRIFLIELTFSILFFIIVVAVCVQCFARAYIMGKDSTEKTMAINAASNVAEEFLATDDKESFTVYLNKDWDEISDAADGEYTITGIAVEEDSIIHLNITVAKLDTEDTIYSLEVEKALPYLED